MTNSHRVYYQSIKDPEAYLAVYSALRAEPTNALQMAAIFEFLPDMNWKNTSTLEVACGGGVFTKKLMEMGVQHASCCDIEETCVTACRMTNPKATVINSSVTDLAFANDEFDLVLAIDIIEHIEPDAVMLAELNRVLRPGGYVVICTQNDMSIENVVGRMVSFIRRKEWKGWDPTHVRFYNSISLRRLLKKQGFVNVKFNGTLYLPFHFIGRLFGKPLEIMGYKKTAQTVERIVSWPVYALNYLFEAFSRCYPLNVLGWGIIVIARKPENNA